jgi:hypothetical protein
VCNDGNACTAGDACNAGSCAEPPFRLLENRGLRSPGPVLKLTWTGVAGVVYDLVSSTLAELAAHGTATAACLADDHAVDYNDDRPDPTPNAGYYYLVRAQSTCGSGTYGYASAGTERLPTAACP